MENQYGFNGMRLLTKFQIQHRALGRFVLLHSSFLDTLAGISSAKATVYPDQNVMIRLSEAKALIAEL